MLCKNSISTLKMWFFSQQTLETKNELPVFSTHISVHVLIQLACSFWNSFTCTYYCLYHPTSKSVKNGSDMSYETFLGFMKEVWIYKFFGVTRLKICYTFLRVSHNLFPWAITAVYGLFTFSPGNFLGPIPHTTAVANIIAPRWPEIVQYFRNRPI